MRKTSFSFKLTYKLIGSTMYFGDVSDSIGDNLFCASEKKLTRIPHLALILQAQNSSVSPPVHNSNPSIANKNYSCDEVKCDLGTYCLAILHILTSYRELYMKQGQGFLLVFSITSMSSLNELSELREQIIRIKDDEKVPLVIVGNKSDLEDDRAVPRAKAFGLSQSWGNAPYYETSARRRANVNEVFVDLCRQIIRKDLQGSGSSSGSSRQRDANRIDRKRDTKNPRRRSPCVIL